jgi:hypothetical protein
MALAGNEIRGQSPASFLKCCLKYGAAVRLLYQARMKRQESNIVTIFFNRLRKTPNVDSKSMAIVTDLFSTSQQS